MPAGARDHGRIPCGLWNSKPFRALSRTAQAMWAQLTSDRDVNNAGVLPLQVAKWAGGCDEMTEADIWRDLTELAKAGFIVVDRDTFEVLLRSHLRDDGLLKHKYIWLNAMKCIRAAASPQIRKALAIELYKLQRPEATELADELAGEPDPDPDEMPSESHSDPTPSTPVESHSNAIPIPSGSHPEPTPSTPSETMASECHPDHCGEGEGEGVSNCSEIGYVERSSSSETATKADQPERPDAEALCAHLCDRIRANGSKAAVTKRWRIEARLLLDRDGRDFDKAMRLIDWSQDHHFWKTNILSMPKFRAKYDQLRLQANAEYRPQLAVVNGGMSRADEKVARYLSYGTPSRGQGELE
ncbi:hypothetical protein [Nocardia sp. NPDC057227]|uniref:hypothetical protein n=1 Tax=Nocardia sp. NPDC057227 TaxID=3346056 RepID=UPI0036441BAC